MSKNELVGSVPVVEFREYVSSLRNILEFHKEIIVERERYGQEIDRVRPDISVYLRKRSQIWRDRMTNPDWSNRVQTIELAKSHSEMCLRLAEINDLISGGFDVLTLPIAERYGLGRFARRVVISAQFIDHYTEVHSELKNMPLLFGNVQGLPKDDERQLLQDSLSTAMQEAFEKPLWFGFQDDDMTTI